MSHEGAGEEGQEVQEAEPGARLVPLTAPKNVSSVDLGKLCHCSALSSSFSSSSASFSHSFSSSSSWFHVKPCSSSCSSSSGIPGAASGPTKVKEVRTVWLHLHFPSFREWLWWFLLPSLAVSIYSQACPPFFCPQLSSLKPEKMVEVSLLSKIRTHTSHHCSSEIKEKLL